MLLWKHISVWSQPKPTIGGYEGIDRVIASWGNKVTHVHHTEWFVIHTSMLPVVWIQNSVIGHFQGILDWSMPWEVWQSMIVEKVIAVSDCRLGHIRGIAVNKCREAFKVIAELQQSMIVDNLNYWIIERIAWEVYQSLNCREGPIEVQQSLKCFYQRLAKH